MTEPCNLPELQAEVEALSRVVDERDRRYTENRENDRKMVELALANSQRATDKFEDAQAARDAKANEFRSQLDDQAKRLMDRGEAIASLSGLRTEVLGFVASNKREVDATMSNLTGLLGSVGSRLDKIEGKSQGVSSALALGITIIGLLMVIAGFVVGITVK